MKFKREARWWGCDPILLANFNRIHGSHTFTIFHNGFWYKFINQCLSVAFTCHTWIFSLFMLCINPSLLSVNNWDKGIWFNLISCRGAAKLYFSDILPCLICGERWGLVTLKFQLTSVIVAVVLREKEKLKEREEAWLKIDKLARKNPNVSKLYHQIIEDKYSTMR